MLHSGKVGFLNAPFSKGLLLSVVALNLIRAIIGKGKLEFSNNSFFLQSVFQYLFSGNLVFSSNVEVFLGCIIIYVFRLFERHWGTQRFAKFYLFSTYFSLCLQLFIKYLLGDPRPIISGPYGFIFVTEKHTIYFICLQFILQNIPNSLLASLSGGFSGVLYQYILSNIFKIDRMIQFPQFLIQFCKNVLLPLLGTNTSRNQNNNSGRRRNNSPNVNDNNINIATGGLQQQQALNMMRGNLMQQQQPFIQEQDDDGLSEENIRMLMQMGFTRDQCEMALRHANNDVHMATELLLSQ
ncbi:hypothetical protein ABK040_008879 [Willaertia magna]